MIRTHAEYICIWFRFRGDFHVCNNLGGVTDTGELSSAVSLKPGSQALRCHWYSGDILNPRCP